MDNIRLKEGESWETGLNRLIDHARAAAVITDRPYLAEETYHWMVMMVEGRYHLLDRAVALCFQQVDQVPFHAPLISVMTNSRTLLQLCPIDIHASGSPRMKMRGEVCRACFRNFVATLEDQSQFFAPPPSNMAALQTKSLRLPPGEDNTRQSRQAGYILAL